MDEGAVSVGAGTCHTIDRVQPPGFYWRQLWAMPTCAPQLRPSVASPSTKAPLLGAPALCPWLRFYVASGAPALCTRYVHMMGCTVLHPQHLPWPPLWHPSAGLCWQGALSPCCQANCIAHRGLSVRRGPRSRVLQARDRVEDIPTVPELSRRPGCEARLGCG